MKRLIFILIAAAAVLSSYAEGLSPQMANFREGALLLIEGIANADRDALADASDLLDKAYPEELDNLDVTLSSADALSYPLVLFTPDFCDTVRKNNFQLVALNPLEALRACGGVVSLVTRSIAPGAEAVFHFDGSDTMQLVTACSTPSALQTVINAGDLEISPVLDPEGYTSQTVWELPSVDTPFTITVRNPTSKPLSFVIALQ